MVSKINVCFLPRLFISYALGCLLVLLNGCTSAPQEAPTPPPQTKVVEEKLKEPLEISQGEEISPQNVFAPKQTTLKIALLLPLTGEKKDLGLALSKAAELSLLNASSKPSIEIFMRDTGEGPDMANEALSTLLKEEDIDLILGPLTAEETSAITPVAWDKVIPILSFSNVSKIAGDNVFIMGFSPEEQMKEVITFALSHNLSTFVIIAPVGDYGRLITDSIRQNLYSFPQAKLKDIILYNPMGTDLEEKLQSLNLTNVEALIIPEGGERLLQIVEFLNKDPVYQTIKPRLIGSGQWDDPSTLTNPLLQGAWFPGTRMDRRAEFNADYFQSYGETAPRLASLGYDGMSIATEIAALPNKSVVEVLTRPQGFQEIDGSIRFTPEGQSIRTWHMYEINASFPNHIKLLNTINFSPSNNSTAF